MDEPRRFPAVLNLAITIITVLNALVGFFGYWQYGNQVNVLITLDLPNDWYSAQFYLWYKKTSVKIMARRMYRDDDDYDPHIERVAALDHPTNDIETLFHMLTGLLGTGILAMPEGFKNAGIFNGLIYTAIAGSLLTYCIHLLIHTEYAICKKRRTPIMKYSESMKAAVEMGPQWSRKYASTMGFIVDIFLILNQVGVCSVYIVFIGRNAKYVIDQWIGMEVGIELYMLVSSVFLLLIHCVRNLKYLAPFSIVATVLQSVVFAIVGYYLFSGLPKFGENVVMVGSLWNAPIFFGTTMFALLSLGVFISCEYNMKTPKSFHCLVNISSTVSVTLYSGIGFVGYWRYADKVESAITLNLPKTHLLVQIIIFASCWVIVIGYALQAYSAFEIIWFQYKKKLLGEDNKSLLAWEYLTRVEFFVGTFVFGVTIPLLGLVISLVGSFCLSTLGIMFPAMMRICIVHPKYGKLKWELIRNILLIIIGIVAFLTGTYCCILEIAKEMIKGV